MSFLEPKKEFIVLNYELNICCNSNLTDLQLAQLTLHSRGFEIEYKNAKQNNHFGTNDTSIAHNLDLIDNFFRNL
jgi:hypothetical protein